jgi:hypothetical protein
VVAEHPEVTAIPHRAVAAVVEATTRVRAEDGRSLRKKQGQSAGTSTQPAAALALLIGTAFEPM